MLERRPPVEALLSEFSPLFDHADRGHGELSEDGFTALLEFLRAGEPSYQGLAAQMGVRWCKPSQRVALRKQLASRGFLSPSCLWAFRHTRGEEARLFCDYPSPDMAFMQVLLLKEAHAKEAIPFLIEHFVQKNELAEELKGAARLSILRLLDTAGSPTLLRSLQGRYPGVEILFQWRPAIPLDGMTFPRALQPGTIDFHDLVRSVHDLKELSSLARTLYLLSLFYIPLTKKEWQALLLSRTDVHFFNRLMVAGVIQVNNGGFGLTTDPSKQTLVKQFLYDSYALARKSVSKAKAERSREERERKVRNTELDRQALATVPDGLVCVDASGGLYYVNPAAEEMLQEHNGLKERLFGSDPLEKALASYSPERVLSRVNSLVQQDQEAAEVFGDRVVVPCGGRRFEVELHPQIMMLRETTDQHLVDQEIGKLYRHELKAALDVMGAGLSTARHLIGESKTEEGLAFLDQVEDKRKQLFSLLEERIDFIRLHSDSFQIRRSHVNLALIVDTCLGNYAETAHSKNLSIKSNHLQAPAVHVAGEERFLVRALDNLLRNAVRHSDAGSEITVFMGADGPEGFVRVQDRGPGIPAAHLGKIFQLGFTTGGTGRGLYLARKIVVAHRGRIEVKNRNGGGASFTIYIPLSREA